MGRFEGRYLSGRPSDRRYDSAGAAEFFRCFFESGVVALEDNLRVEKINEDSAKINPGQALLDGYLTKVVATNDDPYLIEPPEGRATAAASSLFPCFFGISTYAVLYCLNPFSFTVPNTSRIIVSCHGSSIKGFPCHSPLVCLSAFIKATALSAREGFVMSFFSGSMIFFSPTRLFPSLYIKRRQRVLPSCKSPCYLLVSISVTVSFMIVSASS